jgi:hypothetical protein
MGKGAKKKKLGHRLTDMERAFIVFRWINGDGLKKMARECKVSRNTVKDLMKKYQETGAVYDYPRSGRPRCTSEREDRHIVKLSKNNRFLTAKALALKQCPSFTKNRVSVTTVKSRLAEKNLNGRVAAQKPLLSEKNIKARYKWALAHRDWTLEQWHKVIFSDESPFQVFQSGGKVYVRRAPGERFSDECITPTVKHGGGSIQVWWTPCLTASPKSLLSKEGTPTTNCISCNS